MAKDLRIKENFYFDASPEIIRRAKLLRMSMTPAERVLWESLRRKQLKDIRFRRQHPISCFIVDFFCHRAGLVIEIDGDVHSEKEQSERDENRTYELEKLGLRVIRFSNEEVLNETQKVLDCIQNELPDEK
jgi:very-short-patch-repair endonuclease